MRNGYGKDPSVSHFFTIGRQNRDLGAELLPKSLCGSPALFCLHQTIQTHNIIYGIVSLSLYNITFISVI